MKKRECSRCGCQRSLLTTAKVHAGHTTISFKTLCFPCLLRSVDLLEGRGLNYDRAMSIVKEVDEPVA